MSQVDNLLSGGNVLAGAVQAMADASKNPSGVDLAALYMTTYSTVMGGLQILSPNSAFMQALTSATGVNFGALGFVINGVQLTNAYNTYVQTLQTSNSSAQAAALADLGDKLGATVAAIGGTMAAVPIPAVQQVGLGICVNAVGISPFFPE